jgi:hypothetical protein
VDLVHPIDQVFWRIAGGVLQMASNYQEQKERASMKRRRPDLIREDMRIEVETRGHASTATRAEARSSMAIREITMKTTAEVASTPECTEEDSPLSEAGSVEAILEARPLKRS